MSVTVALVFLAVCLGWVAFQLLYTRSYRRNLERHTAEMQAMYARHSARLGRPDGEDQDGS